MELPFNFGTDRIESAMHLIEDREWDCIHCSLTGSRYAIIEESEIKLCLQMELHKNPLASAEDLADSFELRHYAISSGPAPSLRVHKDHSQLLRVLQLDSDGPARLFTYLSARLFYEALMHTRDLDSTAVRMHRMQFMLDMHARIADLPENWHESLTADDEMIPDASILGGIIAELAQPVDENVAEGKAAQRCLESLLRLDGIYNIRSAIYDNDLKVRIALFRESDWTFGTYIDLLSRIENDNIVRLQGKGTVEGNSMSLTTLLASIGKTSQRMSPGMKKFLVDLEGPIEAANDKGTGSKTRIAGATLLALVNETLGGGKNVSRENLKRLESVRSQLQRDLDSVSYSDKRLVDLHHIYGKSGEHLGKAKVIHGDMVTKRLYESLKEKGLPIKPHIQARFDAAVKAGTITKKSSTRKPKGPLKGLNLSMSNVLDDAIASGVFGSLMGKESK